MGGILRAKGRDKVGIQAPGVAAPGFRPGPTDQAGEIGAVVGQHDAGQTVVGEVEGTRLPGQVRHPALEPASAVQPVGQILPLHGGSGQTQGRQGAGFVRRDLLVGLAHLGVRQSCEDVQYGGKVRVGVVGKLIEEYCRLEIDCCSEADWDR